MRTVCDTHRRDAEHVTTFFAQKGGLAQLAPPQALAALVAAPAPRCAKQQQQHHHQPAELTPVQRKMHDLALELGPWASPECAVQLASF